MFMYILSIYKCVYEYINLDIEFHSLQLTKKIISQIDEAYS